MNVYGVLVDDFDKGKPKYSKWVIVAGLEMEPGVRGRRGPSYGPAFRIMEQ